MSLLDKTLLQDAIIIVRKASEFIISQYGLLKNDAIETKSLNSLVSYVDKESEKILVDGLNKLIPESAFLTEEETIKHSNGDYLWIIDPLDGTTNFIHQIPFFAISVALQYKNETILGIVMDVTRGDIFYATKNNGSFLNGAPITVSSNNLLSDSLVATGFPYYDFKNITTYIATLRFLMEKTRGIRRCGAAALDLCYTASGRFDVFFEFSLAPWDVAAGAFIVQEAGGFVTDSLGGNDFLYGKSIIAGNKSIHSELMKII